MQKYWQKTLIKRRSLNFSEIAAASTGVFFVEVHIEATVFLDIFRAEDVPRTILDTVGISRFLPLFGDKATHNLA